MTKIAKSMVLGLTALTVAAGISGCSSDNGTGPSPVAGTVSSVSVSVNPKSGIAASMTKGFAYEFTGVITVTGPTTISYRWERSTGELEPVQELVFGGAGSLSVSYTWTMVTCFGADRPRSARLLVISPNVMESSQVSFNHNCWPAL